MSKDGAFSRVPKREDIVRRRLAQGQEVVGPHFNRRFPMRRCHPSTLPGRSILAFAALLLAGCDDGPVSPETLVPEPALAQVPAAGGPWQSFEVMQTNDGPPPPFETRIRGNTRHDLGVQVSGTLDGDIVGTFTATIDAHLHGDPRNPGVWVGPARLDGTWVVDRLFGEPVTGTFEVKGQGHRILPGPFSGRLTAKGTGDLAGMTFQATFENGPAPGSFVIVGRIHGA